MIDVFLLLGSNLGRREMFLRQAISQIGSRIAPVSKMSSVYETQSWGKSDQPDYLNQVILLKTSVSAEDVLDKILAIEQEMGRERHEKWGSRTIDIDILFYGDKVINTPELTVPHPELHNRRFTLEPLEEIAPEFFHPVLKKTIAEIKNKLKDSLIVKKF